MLKKVKTKSREVTKATQGTYAIVASLYNQPYVDSMVKGAKKVLGEACAEKIEIIRVPGAYEIPVVAAKLAEKSCYAAIICLGVVIRGETAHAQLIGEAVTQALMQIQVQQKVPVIHEVLLLENTQQAKVRCLNPEHNRGIEAAQTALTMAKILGR